MNHTFKRKFGASICTAARVSDPTRPRANKDNRPGSVLTEMGQDRSSHFEGAEDISVKLCHKIFVSGGYLSAGYTYSVLSKMRNREHRVEAFHLG